MARSGEARLASDERIESRYSTLDARQSALESRIDLALVGSVRSLSVARDIEATRRASQSV